MRRRRFTPTQIGRRLRHPEAWPRSAGAWGVLLAYAALTAWWVWPLPPVASTHAFVPERSLMGGADYYLIVWAMSWVAHALVTAPWDLFAANSFYPSSLSLAYSEHFIGQQPLFGPVYLVTGNPVLAANVVIAGGQFLCAAAMYALARRFVPAPAAFVTGALYAFCPLRYQSIEHFHLLGTQYLPLVVLLTERWLESARRRDAVLLTAALVAQTLSSIYLAYGTALLYGVYVPLALWYHRGALDGRRWLGLAAAGLVTLGLLVITSLPYLELRSLGIIPSYGAEQSAIGITAAARMMRHYLHSGGVGWVGYGLAAVALVPPFRARAWPGTIALAAILVGTLIGTGHVLHLWRWTIPTPYPWLMEWLPGFATIRVPVRLALVAQLGFSLLAGLGAARILVLAPRATRPGLALLVVGAALWSLGPWPARHLEARPVGAAVPPAYRWLAQHGEGRVVLELPPTSHSENAKRMFLSTVHWLPIVGGYSAYTPRTAQEIERLGSRLPASHALQAIVDTVDVGWILVHLDQLPIAGRWRHLPDGLSEEARWRDALLLRVTRPGDPVRRARTLSTRETPEGLPLAPLGPRCPGRIEVRGGLPAVLDSKRTFQLTVEIHNEGREPWPAFGFVPRHLVRLRACVTTAGRPCPSRPIYLPSDVHPGRPVQTTVPVWVPALLRGERLVHVELEQAGDGPLARCGVAPLTLPLTRAGVGRGR